MSSLLVAIPVWSGDYEQVLRNITQLSEGGPSRHSAAIVYQDEQQYRTLLEIAKKCFPNAVWPIRFYADVNEMWPRKNNLVWQATARAMEISTTSGYNGWLFLEPDTLPLKAQWLDAISDAYVKARKPFMGNVSATGRLDSTAVYPFNISDYCEKAMLTKTTHFSDVLSREVKKDHIKAVNDLMAVHPVMYNKSGIGPSGRAISEDIEKIAKKFPQAVMYHGIEPRGSVIKTDASHVATVAPLYTISVLCMNHSDLTRNCLDSIIEHSSDYELFVTNNGSTDDTPDMLRDYAAKLGDKMHVITNAENKGFQEPNENVLKLALGRYIVLFNNDMEACEGWLDGLRKPFDESPKMALTGIAGVCCAINQDLKGVHGDDSKPEYIEGGCLMAPVALIRKHGLFSPYLKFIYWEDTDLGLRMREMGYSIATVRLPINHNHRSATTKHLDLTEVRSHNHKAMISRWGFYLKRRNFERRVLIKRRGARGDVLLLTPVISALKRKWPQCLVGVKTAHPEMLTKMHDLHFEQLEKEGVDFEYDLDSSYEKRPGIPIVEAYAQDCGVTVTSHRPIIIASESDLSWGRTVARGKRVALIHPGPTTWPGKNWPYERFEEVVAYLRKNGFFTVAVGASDSPSLGCDDSVAGVATVSQLYALCRESSLFVGVDSMPQHVASAADIPSVILFGATDPLCIQRKAKHLIAVQASRKDAECVGAHGRRTGPVANAPCDGSCMKAIKTSMVIKVIDKLI